MHRNKLISSVLLFCGAIAVFFVTACTADTKGQIQELLKRVPAANIAEENTLNAQFAATGAEGISELCRMLVAPGSGDDSKVRLAVHGLAVYVTRAQAENERKMFAETLCRALKELSDGEVKAFLIEQLQLAGGDESTAVLSEYLSDKRLCRPAAQALTAIGTDTAKQFMLKATDSSQGESLAAVITALGELRYEAAALKICGHLGSSDAVVRQAALWAAANTGCAEAKTELTKAFEEASGYEKSVAGANYILFAQRLCEKGQESECIGITRKILAGYKNSSSIMCAALSTLVRVAGDKAIGDIFAAVESGDFELGACALGFAEKTGDSAVTEQWSKKISGASPQLRADIISMLGRRGDKSAFRRVVDALSDDDKMVRLAAVDAAAKLGGTECADSLLGLLKRTDDRDEVRAVTDTLMRIGSPDVLKSVAASLPQIPSAGRAGLIAGLADLRAKEYKNTIFAQTGDNDAGVRLAAIRALDLLAGPEDMPAIIELIVNAKSGAERAAAQTAAVTVARQIPEGKQADEVIKAIETCAKEQKIHLLRTAGRIGGQKALKVVTDRLQSDDADIKDAAIRALADWPDAGAVGALLDVAKSSQEMKYRVLALRSSTELLKKADMPASQKVELYGKAMEISQRPDEKKLVLAGLAEVRTTESLELAAGCLGEPAFAGEAALACVQIACPQDEKEAGLTSSSAGAILTKAAELLTDTKLAAKVKKHLDSIAKNSTSAIPAGFIPLFNGKDLTGWKGVLLSPYDNPIRRAALSAEDYAKEQVKADENMRAHWSVEDGVLVFDGRGFSLSTAQDYGDFELLVDWKIESKGDSGIYLRGSPQVQIWDTAQWPEGSGGLYNNQKNPSKPLVCADNPIGQWNKFRIIMSGERVTVYLNDKLIVDNVVLENYWDRKQPIFPTGPIELQCHGHRIYFNNIFIRRIPQAGLWAPLFNGKDLAGWTGDTKGYVVEDEKIICRPGGNLYTEKEFSDFHLKFEFKLIAGANNGLGIRAPLSGDSAYKGMEIQILDNTDAQYAALQPYQYHGSIYGVVPAKREYLNPVGQWNREEVIARGKQITVILNGTVIVDADIDKASAGGTMDHKEHPGLKNEKGHIGFLGHGSVVEFRNITIMEL